MTSDMLLLDHPDVLRVLFHPRRGYGTGMADHRPVMVEVAPGVTLGGRLYPAAANAPLILYYHGNGEIADDYDDIAVLYTQLGISLLVMDYRGYGASGDSPTSSTLLTDAVAVFDTRTQICDQHNLTPQRIYVMGRSLGSVTAIEIARYAGEHLDGLIIESGFSDTFGLLMRLGLQVQGAEEEQHGFGNGFKMEQVRIPTLILHGQSDVLIPHTDGQELYRRCAATTKHLVLIPDAGHNDILITGMAVYFDAIRAFVFPGA